MELMLAHRPWWRPLPVMTLCIGCALTGALLLRRDFQRAQWGSDAPRVATLEHTQRSVRRKPAGSFLWTRLDSGASLHRKDAVQVGKQSSATIRLSDGSLLEVGENSLVVMEDVQQLALNFLQGSFVVRKSTGDTLVHVERGKAVTRAIPVRLAAPSAHTRLYVPEQQARLVAFQWEFPSEQSPVDTLEITQGTSFDPSRTRQVPLSEAKREMELRLAAGNYSWRLLAKGRPVTETRAFELVPLANPRIFSPGPDQTLSTWKKASRIPFSWEPLSGEPVSTRLEVSDDAGFSRLQFEAPVSGAGGSAWLEAVAPGEYFWRLRASYGDQTVLSKPLRFKLTTAQTLSIRVLAPAPNAAFEQNTSVDFRWELPGMRPRFHFQLANQEGETLVLDRPDLAASQTSWAGKSGRYRWRVQAFQDGDLVGESAWRELGVFENRPIALAKPREDSRFEYWKTPPSFEFEWESEPVAGSHFVIDISKDATFAKDVSQHKVESSPFPAPKNLDEGIWHWRVRLTDADGNTVRTSPGSSFTLARYPLLAAPDDASPSNGHRFQVEKSSQSPLLEWDEVDQATAYRVRLESGKTVRWFATKKTRLRIPNLGPGKYRWSVQAVDPAGRPGTLTAKNALEILPPRRLRAPKLKIR